MAYVDGFLVPVLKKNLKAYIAMSKKAGKIWREHGALDYKECVGDDLEVEPGCGVPFPKQMKLKTGEVPVFAFIIYKSRSHRDAVNKKVMADPRLAKVFAKMPFDLARSSHGGFKAVVDA